MTIKITILGATGSIGKSTLDIVRQHPDHFKIVGLTTNTNIVEFEKLLNEFKPKKAVLTHLGAWLDYDKLKKLCPVNVEPGYDGLIINLT